MVNIKILDNFFVFWAFITNNYHGKQEDVHGRTYKSTYKKFGHIAMMKEYQEGNTWLIKRRL